MFPRPRIIAAAIKAFVPLLEDTAKRINPSILRKTPNIAVNLGPR